MTLLSKSMMDIFHHQSSNITHRKGHWNKKKYLIENMLLSQKDTDIIIQY